MTEILSSLITPEIQAFLTALLVFVVILYILSIVWTVRDAYLRGTSPIIWGIVAIIPFLGCMIYAMMRPPLYASDKEEQNVGLLLQQRELMAYGECPQCGYPTERDYVICPNCHTRLKNLCGQCGHTLEPEWTVCPYCASNVVHAPQPHAQQPAANRRIQQGRQAQLPTQARQQAPAHGGQQVPSGQQIPRKSGSQHMGQHSTSGDAAASQGRAAASRRMTAPPTTAASQGTGTAQRSTGAAQHAPQTNRRSGEAATQRTTTTQRTSQTTRTSGPSADPGAVPRI